jgi:hypothetical protein
MKAISIQQPWAYAILHLGKDVENRTWKTKYRGRILIHAGKTIDKKGVGWLNDLLLREGSKSLPEDLPTGGIVGAVEITGVIDKSYPNIWFFGPYGWKLKNPIAFPFVPYKGQLGIFECKDKRYDDPRVMQCYIHQALVHECEQRLIIPKGIIYD